MDYCLLRWKFCPCLLICIELVGPFTIKTPLMTYYSPLASTMTEPANKLANSIRHLFHNTWLARFSHPQSIVFGNSVDEIKRDFRKMCSNYGIVTNQLMS
jgi:hypothetical protein